MKILVADPSESIRHPGKAVSDVLLDLNPILQVQGGLITITVHVADDDPQLAETAIAARLRRAGLLLAARIIGVGKAVHEEARRCFGSEPTS